RLKFARRFKDANVRRLGHARRLPGKSNGHVPAGQTRLPREILTGIAQPIKNNPALMGFRDLHPRALRLRPAATARPAPRREHRAPPQPEEPRTPSDPAAARAATTRTPRRRPVRARKRTP